MADATSTIAAPAPAAPPPPVFTDKTTLGEARAWLLAQAKVDGASCPCCKQFTRIYRRGLGGPMARTLIRAYRLHGLDPWHLPTVTGGASGDNAKLAYWGFIVPLPGEREDGSRRHGWWRITEYGAAWVQDRVRVPRYAVVYAGRCLGLDKAGEQEWGVQDALGPRFNYRELMDDPAGAGGDGAF